MKPFWLLLRRNSNYRATWMGQVVSEVGDHFNSIAVLSLTLHLTGSGLAVGAVMVSRVLPAILAAPVAGVLLDRMDRKKIMILSDLVRSAIALLFIVIPIYKQTWLLYLLSGMLTFAAPFFTSGRSAILPRVATGEELHSANALTQTTSWLTLSIGTMLGGISIMQFGYEWAFVANSASFLFSAWAIASLRSPMGHFRPEGVTLKIAKRNAWGQDFFESLRYMRQAPLILSIALAGVGWATGGGAAQILFTLFGEVVYKRGAGGIGLIWGFAGIGLVIGGISGHRLGRRLGFAAYKNAVFICFLVHGISYMLFSAMPTIWWALVFIVLSRVAMGINSVLNKTLLLTHVPDRFRGRVFTTVDMMMNATMMISMSVAGIATGVFPIRTIGVVAGALSTSTAVFWLWANLAGKMPEPSLEAGAEEEFEGPVVAA